MKKIILSCLFALFFLLSWDLVTNTSSTIEADWWVRPTEREAQPTREPRISLAPREPEDLASPTPVAAAPTNTPVPAAGTTSSNDDPCAPGKSYVGSNCGWSPGINEYKHDSSSGGSTITGYGTGGGEVLGLSDTSSSSVSFSDLLTLSGALCILVYLKSKLHFLPVSKRQKIYLA